MEKMTTLSAVIAAATDEGTWADTFDCVVKRGEPKNGNKPSKASCYDPANGQEAKLAWFGGDLRQYEGQTIRIGGKGNKAKIYGGKTEISIGKNGTITATGAAPQSQPPPSPGGNAPQSDAPKTGNPPPATRPRVDPTTYFHKEMSKAGLLWAHSFQYAQNTEQKIMGEGKKFPPDQFQALVSSLFIRADRAGLMEHVPALRQLGTDGVPLRFVPPQPDPALVEKERLRKEAEAEAARKLKDAEEAAQRAREAAHDNQHHPQENLDEDVPF